MRRSLPPLIALTGIDGCGKSTQAGMLVRRLQAEGWDTRLIWTGGRPYLSRPLIRLVKRRFRAPVQAADGTFTPRDASSSPSEEFSSYLRRTQGMFRRRPVLAWGWRVVSLLEHAAEANWYVLPQSLRGRAVVSDRYLYKSVVNLAVLQEIPPERIGGLARHPLLRLVRWPTLYVLLDLPADVAAARKRDLPATEYVDRRVPLYRALAQATGMPVIDATQTPEVIHEQLWELVERTLRERGMRPR